MISFVFKQNIFIWTLIKAETLIYRHLHSVVICAIFFLDKFYFFCHDIIYLSESQCDSKKLLLTLWLSPHSWLWLINWAWSLKCEGWVPQIRPFICRLWWVEIRPERQGRVRVSLVVCSCRAARRRWNRQRWNFRARLVSRYSRTLNTLKLSWKLKWRNNTQRIILWMSRDLNLVTLLLITLMTIPDSDMEKISKKSQKFQRRYFKKWKKYFLNYHYYNYSVTDYKYVTAALRLSRKWC